MNRPSCCCNAEMKSHQSITGSVSRAACACCRTEPPSLEGALTAIRDVKEAAVNATAQPQHRTNATAAAAAAAADTGPAAAAAEVGLVVTESDLASPSELSSAADAALKHLLLYVDVDQLYQAALGLYDLPLAFMVVSHSQVGDLMPFPAAHWVSETRSRNKVV
jgi:hypothetical protein